MAARRGGALSVNPPPGPPPTEDGPPDPAWISFVAVLIMASPGLFILGVLIGAFLIFGGGR
jgi:hypothetical protein